MIAIRQTSPLLLAPLLGVALLASAGVPADAHAAYQGADDPAYKTLSNAARNATLCLLNKERRQRGLSGLKAHADLRKAAKKHTRRMISQDCFSHTCSGEADLSKRIEATSYLSCNCSWSVGENIGYGYGSKSTPKWMVEAWMDSSGHRENILNGSFEHIGIGVESGSPTGGSDQRAATYTTTFGARG